MAAALPPPSDLLTPRQLEVLELLTKGLTNADIARVLGIAAATAKNHVAAVLEALDVTNRTEAAGLLVAGPEPEETSAEVIRAIPGFGQRPALALLPLDNLGPPEDDYIADGLVEDLTTALAAWRWFPVIARNSTFVYKGRQRGVDIRRVSEELGARYVLEGSARRSGDRLRVHIQLIDGPSGEHHWARRYDRTFQDLFAVQDEIVADIVSVLEPTLARIERVHAKRKPPEDLDAWSALQRGLDVLWRQRIGDPIAAEQFIQRAIELEPGGAAAYAALSSCQCMQALTPECDDMFAKLADAQTAARRAIELDPMDYAGYTGLGASLGLSGQVAPAREAHVRAVDLNPSSAQGWFGLGALSLLPGTQEEAVAHCERALRLSPHDPIRHHYFGVHSAALLWLGRHEEALTSAVASVEAEPSLAFSYRPMLPALYGILGRTEEALAARERILKIDPNFTLAASRALAHPELVDKVAEGYRTIGWDVG